MIEIIENLLNHLYPNTPPIDILTRKSVNPSIPHTREPQAMAAITQAQRINRDSDYDCSGLCEFHIGIIYLHWHDFSGAGQQFALARRQWRFVNRKTAVCLAHFAEGYALESNFAYEPALIIYKQAVRCLLKQPESSFSRDLQQELTSAQIRIHQQLLNLASPPIPQPVESSTHHVYQSEPTIQPVSPPISNIHQISSQVETGTPASGGDVPIPKDNMQQTDSQINTPPPQDNMGA